MWSLSCTQGEIIQSKYTFHTSKAYLEVYEKIYDAEDGKYFTASFTGFNDTEYVVAGLKMKMKMNMHVSNLLLCILILIHSSLATAENVTADELYEIASSLKMFVDELPKMPTLKGYMLGRDGDLKAGELRIGMFEKKWVQDLYSPNALKYALYSTEVNVYLYIFLFMAMTRTLYVFC
jgi:hypothetical protein